MLETHTSGKCNTKSAYRACLQRLEELGEPTPRQVHPVTVQLRKQIWRNKYITPGVQAFGWRFLRRALPTGARAGKYSTHISTLCSRCGLEEDNIQLFFTCNFARAAWFNGPWFIRSNYLTANCDSLSQIILNLLNMNHPHASLPNILTFMWCLWKSRNDNLFGRKEGAPHQIQHMAHAIQQNLELVDTLQTSSMQEQEANQQIRDGTRTQPGARPGSTIKTDLSITGPKLYSDAAWKTHKIPGAAGITSTGLGVFCQYQQGRNNVTIFIQSSSSPSSPSPLQAEALALLLAARAASLLQLHHATFLTDNQFLARAAAASSTVDPQVLWEIRPHIANFKQASQELAPTVYHIARDLNAVAHNCAQQVIRQTQSEPIFSCSNSAHTNGTCPTALHLHNLNSQGIVLHTVMCL